MFPGSDMRRAIADASEEPDKELVLTLELEGLPPKLMSRMRAEQVYFPPVEWSGTMPMMNWVSTSDEVRWILREPATGRENMDIDWRFAIGDRKNLDRTKTRLFYSLRLRESWLPLRTRNPGNSAGTGRP